MLTCNKPIATSSDRWFDQASLDMDHFIESLSATAKEGRLRPELIGSTIMHYASKWLPELASQDLPELPASVTASWLKKKFIVESIAGILPPEEDSVVPCDFLLRLIRVGGMVRVDPTFQAGLEERAGRRLGEATLGELMIPSFSHTCETLLDVGLVIRLARRFVRAAAEEGGGGDFAKVGKLVDCYLAEAAVDGGLRPAQFVELAGLVPGHARASDDALYRAVDIYLKAHPCLSKQEKKSLWDLIDARKLTQEASLHAAQNERLPVRAVIQVLLSEQAKMGRSIIDRSGSGLLTRTGGVGAGQSEHAGEIKRLKEDVLKLQNKCLVMESQIERLLEGKKKKAAAVMGGYFGLKKVGGFHRVLFKGNKVINDGGGDVVDRFGIKTPARPNRRRSMS